LRRNPGVGGVVRFDFRSSDEQLADLPLFVCDPASAGSERLQLALALIAMAPAAP